VLQVWDLRLSTEKGPKHIQKIWLKVEKHQKRSAKYYSIKWNDIKNIICLSWNTIVVHSKDDQEVGVTHEVKSSFQKVPQEFKKFI